MDPVTPPEPHLVPEKEALASGERDCSVVLAWWQEQTMRLGARAEMLEFAVALADDHLNKRGDAIACHIYLYEALRGVTLSDALQDEARALLEASDV